MDAHEQRFGGVGRLVGAAGLERLKNSHVCVIGIGGVGSWSVEALTRSGIGQLTLIDLDDICITNTNRQIHTLANTIGQSKVQAMAERVASINPDCKVVRTEAFYSVDNAAQLLGDQYDCVIDAIDTVKAKCDLLARCRRNRIPVITVGGAGGRFDASRIRVEDLGRATGDRLLSKVRHQLRKLDGFPNYAGRKFGIECIYSDEAPTRPTCDADTGLRLDCATGFGTATFVTGTFGFLAAQRAIAICLGKP